MLWKAYNLALDGFVAITVEARGNGASTGIASFGIDEPRDLSDAITWALQTFPAINPKKVSLLGQSLGGMFTVLAACQDPRVAATVAYHPPANFSYMLNDEFPVSRLVGGLPNFPMDNASLSARSPIDWINATVPHDILFLHGSVDTLVPPNNSLALSSLANASGHTDTYVIIRPGFAHTDLEVDPTSLTLAIAWLNWSLTYGCVPAPDVLWTRAGNIVLQDVPAGSVDIAGGSLAFAAVALFLLVFVALKGGFPASTVVAPDGEEEQDNISTSLTPRKIQLGIVCTLLAISFLLGLLATAGVFSVAWGYLLYLPIIVLGFGIVMGYFSRRRFNPAPISSAWHDKARARNWVAGLLAVTAAVVYFAVAYNWSAEAIKEPGMSIFNSAFLFYCTVIPLNFLIDPLIIRIFPKQSREGEWSERFAVSKASASKLGKETGIVFLWRIASTIMFLAFIPAVYYSGVPVSINLLLLIGLPVLAAGVYFLGSLLDWGTRSRTLSLVVVAAIIATFLEYRIFRMF